MRTFAILGASALVLLAISGTVTALSGLSEVSFIFLYAAALVVFGAVLFSTRYLARLARTEHRKSRAALLAFGDRMEEAIQQSKAAEREERRLANQKIERLTGTLAETGSYNEKQVELLQSTISKKLSANSRHITNTVRESTKQVEALLHINSKSLEIKPPMPSTGGFAIDAKALSHLLSIVDERRPQRILELGSGTSTIWLGYLCRCYGGRIVTLDHLEQYLDETRSAIDRHGLSPQIETRFAPLEEIECEGETYWWYSTSSLSDLQAIDLVLIDGPPASTGPQARYPALPNIIDLLSPNAVIVLDDVHRQDEENILQSWLQSYPELSRIEMGASRLAVMERL